jgi:hypothetical protein
LAVWAIAQGPIVARRTSTILVHVHRVFLVMDCSVLFPQWR